MGQGGLSPRLLELYVDRVVRSRPG
jgi:hypothetical protein